MLVAFSKNGFLLKSPNMSFFRLQKTFHLDCFFLTSNPPTALSCGFVAPRTFFFHFFAAYERGVCSLKKRAEVPPHLQSFPIFDIPLLYVWICLQKMFHLGCSYFSIFSIQKRFRAAFSFMCDGKDVLYSPFANLLKISFCFYSLYPVRTIGFRSEDV